MLFHPSRLILHSFLTVEVFDVDSIKNCIHIILEKLGRIDVLVTNIGVRKETLIEDITTED
jgi:NADP-dependent 3-hydroxy acid dehydrogenase YdfG